MKYIENFLMINNLKIHFLDNKIPSKELVVLLPPGIKDARFIYDLDIKNCTNRLISISYPARYKSDKMEGYNSVDRIAESLVAFFNEFLSDKKFIKIKIFGFSFGTSIATLVVNKGLKFKGKIELFLINPGEFFNTTYRAVFKLIFLPAKQSQVYRRCLKILICTMIEPFKLSLFPDSKLKAINDQWNSILDYRLPNLAINKKTTLIIGNNDRVIDKKSLDKLKNTFPKAKIFNYDGNHILEYKTSKDYLKFKHLLENLINS